MVEVRKKEIFDFRALATVWVCGWKELWKDIPKRVRRIPGLDWKGLAGGKMPPKSPFTPPKTCPEHRPQRDAYCTLGNVGRGGLRRRYSQLKTVTQEEIRVLSVAGR
jgi:hypothetical protein